MTHLDNHSAESAQPDLPPTNSPPDSRDGDNSPPGADQQGQAELPGVRLRHLTVLAGGRPLLKNASAEFENGRITLILGCSGVGKSVLLRIIAGLIHSEAGSIEFSGSVSVGNSAILTTDARDPDGDGHPDASVMSTTPADSRDVASQVAVVFQNHALFDEFSPIDNVLMAIDHSCEAKKDPPARRRQRAAELLHDLGVPTDRRTSVLSGGQRQRLAIARAMSMEAPVVLYDEPTSGLDANTSRLVADLLSRTQQRHARTTIIVTHDFRALSGIADRMFRFDHQEHKLVELPRDEWDQLPEVLGPPPGTDADGPPPRLSVSAKVTRSLADLMERTGAAAQACLTLPATLVPRWNSVAWGLRMTRHYLRLVAGPSAILYLAVAGIIIGFVATNFTFRFLPYRRYTEPLIIENLLHAVGFALYRIFVPLLGTSLIAARCGAAVASDVGNKVYGSQTAAMKTLRMEPARYLKTPILLAFLIGTPMLIGIAYCVAMLTSIFAFLTTHHEYGVAFWDAHYHFQLREPGSVLFKGTGWLMAKLTACAVGVALITYREGIAPKYSGPDISQGVTRAILWSTLFVLLVHFVFSFFEFKVIQ